MLHSGTAGDTRHDFPQLEYNTRTSEVLGCVSSIYLIKKLARYEDTQARIYRVRQELTAKANGHDMTALYSGKERELLFNNDEPEKVIYFEYYIKKRKELDRKPIIKDRTEKTKRAKIDTEIRPGEKGQAPELGEKIRFQLLGSTKADKDVSVMQFTARVVEIWPGTITLEDKKLGELSTFNENVGLIRVEVDDPYQYSSSLCLLPVTKRRRTEIVYAA